MIHCYHNRRYHSNQCYLYISFYVIIFSIVTTCTALHLLLNHEVYLRQFQTISEVSRIEPIKSQRIVLHEGLNNWNRTLCSEKSDSRGPNQKVIVISVYDFQIFFNDNPIDIWTINITTYLDQIVNEINQTFSQWILRIYVDGSVLTPAQKRNLLLYPNTDICDVSHISKFTLSLPGKMWQFLPILDPYVDFMLTHNLHSPIVPRQIETIDVWLSNDQEKNYFYIVRDHIDHVKNIMPGLWGAAPVRARQELIRIFYPLFKPYFFQRSSSHDINEFLSYNIWSKVKNNALIFDSFFCQQTGGRPFLSQRPMISCFLGCERPCCSKIQTVSVKLIEKPCPIPCRPKTKTHWIYC